MSAPQPVEPVFGRVAVVGLGLLGGSVARAARERGAAERVIGATRSREAAEQALASGAVDAVEDLALAGRDADLVVLATPVYAMKGVLERMGPSLREGAIVTDVGSVKGLLSEVLPGTLPAGVHYVGSHPMAGSHERGIGSARADLFEGKPCVVDASGDAGAADRVARFWEALGARVVRRDADRHDAEVAWTSHVPHLLAFAFARSLARAPEGAFEVAGSGFRDFTRIAKSEAELWSDILGSNRKAIAGPLQAFRDALAELSQAVEAGDAEALEGLLSAARRSLHRASSAEEGPETNPSPNGDRPQQGDRSTPHE